MYLCKWRKIHRTHKINVIFINSKCMQHRRPLRTTLLARISRHFIQESKHIFVSLTILPPFQSLFSKAYLLQVYKYGGNSKNMQAACLFIKPCSTCLNLCRDTLCTNPQPTPHHAPFSCWLATLAKTGLPT